MISYLAKSMVCTVGFEVTFPTFSTVWSKASKLSKENEERKSCALASAKLWKKI